MCERLLVEEVFWPFLKIWEEFAMLRFRGAICSVKNPPALGSVSPVRLCLN